MRHTPGPWTYPKYPQGVATLIYACHGICSNGWGYPVASITFGVPDEEREANALLIAAAPELLKEAKAVIERWDSPKWKDEPATAEFINRLRDAVAKASGHNDRSSGAAKPSPCNDG